MNKQNKEIHNQGAINKSYGKKIRKIKYYHILLVTIACLAVYSNSLKNAFVYDDVTIIVENNLIRSLKNIPLLFTRPVISSTQRMGKGYRPLTVASFAVNYWLGGLNVTGYHIVGIFFHSVNSILVYLLIIMLFRINKGNKDAPGNMEYRIAFFVSLIFAVHPINSEAVNYVWQRSVLMTTCFYLSGIILFIRYVMKKSFYIYLFSLLFLILSLMSKEIAVTFPVMIILIDWYLISGFKKEIFLKNIKKYHLPYMVTVGIFALIRFLIQDVEKEIGFISGKTSIFNYFITQFRVIVKYLKLMLIPSGLSVDHVFPVSEKFLDIRVLISLVIIITIIFLSKRLIRVSKIASLFILWFFIALIPTSSILPLYPIIMNEHRLYLPGIGLFAAFIIILFKFVRDKYHKKILFVLIFMIAIGFSALTFSRNADWKDEFTLWSENIKTYPDSVTSLGNRGNVYRSEGFLDKAVEDYNEVLKIDPDNYEILTNRGVVFTEKGLIDKAMADYNRAIEIEPGYALTYSNRGVIYDRQGFYDEAIADYNMAIKLHPVNSKAYSNRGVIYEKKGIYDKAIADYSKAIKCDSRNPGAYNKLGAFYGKIGKHDKAIANFSKALELDPGFTDARRNRELAYRKKSSGKELPVTNSEMAKESHDRGLEYMEKEMFDKALAEFDMMIRLAPDNPVGYNKRGIIYGMKGNYEKAIDDFTEVIELSPIDKMAYKNRSIAYKGMGKNELAGKDEEKARQLSQKSQ